MRALVLSETERVCFSFVLMCSLYCIWGLYMCAISYVGPIWVPVFLFAFHLAMVRYTV